MIRLDENFYLEPDSNNWTLNYELKGGINPETGKPKVSKDVWYCSRLSDALKRYISEAVKPSESVAELTDRVIKLEEVINNLKIK